MNVDALLNSSKLDLNGSGFPTIFWYMDTPPARFILVRFITFPPIFCMCVLKSQMTPGLRVTDGY